MDLELGGLRKGPHRSDGPVDETAPARWLDNAARREGIESLAKRLEVDSSYFTKMRAGSKPIAGKHLAGLSGAKDATLGFVEELLEEIGYVAVPKAGPTAEAVRFDVLSFLRGQPLLWELYLASARKRLGWNEEQILLALETR